MTNFNEFVASRRVSELADGFKEMSTLQNTRKWVRKERFGLPEYLAACTTRKRFLEIAGWIGLVMEIAN